jgi:hypothetical protein
MATSVAATVQSSSKAILKIMVHLRSLWHVFIAALLLAQLFSPLWSRGTRNAPKRLGDGRAVAVSITFVVVVAAFFCGNSFVAIRPKSRLRSFIVVLAVTAIRSNISCICRTIGVVSRIIFRVVTRFPFTSMTTVVVARSGRGSKQKVGPPLVHFFFGLRTSRFLERAASTVAGSS